MFFAVGTLWSELAKKVFPGQLDRLYRRIDRGAKSISRLTVRPASFGYLKDQCEVLNLSREKF